MAKADGVFIYIGTYPNEGAARADYEGVKDLHALGAVGSYDAAVIRKDAAGKVHVNKDEMATRHGGWVARRGRGSRHSVSPVDHCHGLRGRSDRWRQRPPVAGHVPTDVKELGDLIDANQAALLIVGETTIEDAYKAHLKAEKHVASNSAQVQGCR